MPEPLNEADELEHTYERLLAAFPHLPTEIVREAASTSWLSFDGSKIRDFVPVLAERSARVKLETQLAPSPA